VGKSDPRAFTLLANNIEEAVKNSNSSLVTAAGESLVGIGDPRGVELLERLTKDGTGRQYAGSLSQFRERLRKSLAGAEKTRL
jgi:hypothetical protein